MDPPTGGKAVLFQNRVTGQAALGYAGTEVNIPDLVTDVAQRCEGQPGQYLWAINLAEHLKKYYRGKGELVLTGQSLGGGLATAAAGVNKIPAVTFNAAALASGNVERWGGAATIRQYVTSYHVLGEGLRTVETGLFRASGDSYGSLRLLPPVPGRSAINLHRTPTVIESIQIRRAQILRDAGFPVGDGYSMP